MPISARRSRDFWSRMAISLARRKMALTISFVSGLRRFSRLWP